LIQPNFKPAAHCAAAAAGLCFASVDGVNDAAAATNLNPEYPTAVNSEPDWKEF
jgi:hypothetical protein